ncbi:hypothetical protein MKW98_026313 [Papaver atlanticum]|uniref:Uncharacterized protein n=1 Tax=Papaver atlanticum TaxID=357466 RepID=A0AAD4SNW4_9MAGN|nr:hypothetical protein MKW98_026313 [Papaver atlanticum]
MAETHAETVAEIKIVSMDEDVETDIEAGIKIVPRDEDRINTVRDFLKRMKRISGFSGFSKRMKRISGFLKRMKRISGISEFLKRMKRFFERTNKWTEEDFLDFQDWTDLKLECLFLSLLPLLEYPWLR